MLNRRSFLAVSGAIALSALATGCQGRQAAALVYFLDRALPPQLLRDFRAQASARIKFQREVQLKAIATLLEQWHSGVEQPNRWSWVPIVGGKPKPPGQLVSLGDAWLTTAIQKQWIQPQTPESWSRWSQLPSRWQTLVRRDAQGQLDPQGQVWGAPYRWGMTLMVYNHEAFEKLGWTPQDWSDLWRPELEGRVTVVDQPREVIGLTLKALGQSYNTTDFAQIPELAAKLQALHQNIRAYSSEHYLQPLLLKDAWVAVGWSSDILPALRNYGQLRAVVPQSGTALWADVWVQPQAIAPAAIADQWIDFCWQPRTAQSISLFTDGISPLAAPPYPASAQNPLLSASEDILTRSEFLHPLTIASQEQYDKVWRKVRSAPSP